MLVIKEIASLNDLGRIKSDVSQKAMKIVLLGATFSTNNLVVNVLAAGKRCGRFLMPGARIS